MITQSYKVILVSIAIFGLFTVCQAETVPAARVLVYHSIRPWYIGMSDGTKLYTVRPESFEAQLKYLCDSGYSIISLDDLVSSSENKLPLPPNPVVLTFDDGWKNQYTYAFPIIKKYNATATFFIFTNGQGHSSYLSWDQLREMSNAGMTIGSHSKSHPYLTRMTNKEQLVKEVIGSKEAIESEIGKQVTAFAYPFGLYSETLVSLLKESGYKEARFFGGGAYQEGDNPFTIKSVFVTDDLERFKNLLKTH